MPNVLLKLQHRGERHSGAVTKEKDGKGEEDLSCVTEIKIIDNSWTVLNLGRLNCINFRHITAKD
jgi:hypothetical protein